MKSNTPGTRVGECRQDLQIRVSNLKMCRNLLQCITIILFMIWIKVHLLKIMGLCVEIFVYKDRDVKQKLVQTDINAHQSEFPYGCIAADKLKYIPCSTTIIQFVVCFHSQKLLQMVLEKYQDKSNQQTIRKHISS